ncbi:hypothetical protein Rrhod_3313 [Rhodococcus rhodnii LMG 5362]|uniref:Uncharacterized protein n=1 Tax=Rhodococcus rhodnii LMG 5362 TaxID=1273125 RepID=R7WJQ8_9NOCA|nr:hypothetical protein Rrhod_3313 [Rhodococcus rhodnii LMG 5362]
MLPKRTDGAMLYPHRDGGYTDRSDIATEQHRDTLEPSS